jgi:hypothetical protein
MLGELRGPKGALVFSNWLCSSVSHVPVETLQLGLGLNISQSTLA